MLSPMQKGTFRLGVAFLAVVDSWKCIPWIDPLRLCSCARGAAGGSLLHQLEEKMQVASVQRMVHDELLQAIAQPGGGGECEADKKAALAYLSRGLWGVTQLYRIANRFSLSESALALLHLSSHNDKSLALQLWRQIFQTGERVPARLCVKEWCSHVLLRVVVQCVRMRR